MHTIVVASRKGGVGKTTIAGHLSIAMEGAVALIDLDGQASLSEWALTRAADGPSLFSSRLQTLADDVRSIAAEGFQWLIIDTPPAIGPDIKRAIRVADLVIVPVRPSPHDLRAVGRTVDITDAEGKRMVFVLNGATPRARLTGHAAVELSQHGTVAPVTLHHRIDYQASMIDGRTALELDPSGKSAGEVTQLRNYVVAQLSRHAAAGVRA